MILQQTQLYNKLVEINDVKFKQGILENLDNIISEKNYNKLNQINNLSTAIFNKIIHEISCHCKLYNLTMIKESGRIDQVYDAAIQIINELDYLINDAFQNELYNGDKSGLKQLTELFGFRPRLIEDVISPALAKEQLSSLGIFWECELFLNKKNLKAGYGYLRNSSKDECLTVTYKDPIKNKLKHNRYELKAFKNLSDLFKKSFTDQNLKPAMKEVDNLEVQASMSNSYHQNLTSASFNEPNHHTLGYSITNLSSSSDYHPPAQGELKNRGISGWIKNKLGKN